MSILWTRPQRYERFHGIGVLIANSKERGDRTIQPPDVSWGQAADLTANAVVPDSGDFVYSNPRGSVQPQLGSRINPQTQQR